MEDRRRSAEFSGPDEGDRPRGLREVESQFGVPASVLMAALLSVGGVPLLIG
jgi:hypothetical protein